MSRSESRERRHDVDWLRVLAVLLLIPFHAAIIYAPTGDVPIKSLQRTFYLVPFIAFVHTWHMPLLFFISGIGTWFALGFRTGGDYLKERFLRLVIPLFLGTALLRPIVGYFEYRHLLPISKLQDLSHPVLPGILPRGSSRSAPGLWMAVVSFLFISLLPGMPPRISLPQRTGERHLLKAR